MKLILIAAIFAIAYSTPASISAVAVSATFYNTTGKAADATCGLTVSVTATAATATGFSCVWLVNSKTVNSLVVNDTIVFVSMGYTVSGSSFSSPSATAGFYVANAAITVASSGTPVTTSNAPAIGSLTTANSTVASAGGTWATSFNLTYTQAQYYNSSTSNKDTYWPYTSGADGSTATAYTELLSGLELGTASASITGYSACTTGYTKLASGSTSMIDRLLGSVIAFSFF